MTFYESTHGQYSFVSCFLNNLRLQFGAYAKGYHNAARTVARSLLSRGKFPDYDGYPLVFLYRHALELNLKDFIYSVARLFAFKRIDKIDAELRNDHNLVRLSDIATPLLRQALARVAGIEDLCARIKQTATDLTLLDPDSDGYRYPIRRDGTPSTKRHQIVDAQAFSVHMDELLGDLELLDFAIQAETDKAESIYELIEHMWGSKDDA